MNNEAIYQFINQHQWGVLATVTQTGEPESAVVGIAVTSALELIFDTLGDSRKAQNLRCNAHIAFVIGWDEGITLQYEGLASEPQDSELAPVKQIYFAKFPDGLEREKWNGITYFKVQPGWMRYSDFNQDPPFIVEMNF